MQTSQLFTALQQRQRQRDYRYLTGLVVMLCSRYSSVYVRVMSGFGQSIGSVKVANYLFGNYVCPDLWL